MGQRLLKRNREQTPASSDAWATQPLPTPETRPRYYARQGMWRLRAVRQHAPWLLLLIPVAAIVIAALGGTAIWHETHKQQSKREVAQKSGSFRPRGSSGGRASGSASGSSSGAVPSSGGAAQNASAAASPLTSSLLQRIDSLRAQIAALVRGGVTPGERAKLWRLRLRLALDYRSLVRAQIAALRAGGVTAAERARLDALLAQLRALDKRVAVLKKINRVFRGGVTAAEQTQLQALLQVFARLKAASPLPSTAAITGGTVSQASAPARASAAAGSGASQPATTAASQPATTAAVAGVSTSSTTANAPSPGKSSFGHSHKKPKAHVAKATKKPAPPSPGHRKHRKR